MVIFLAELEKLRQENPNKKISFVSGDFLVIHAGHIRLLRFARDMADILVVGILPHNDYNAISSEEDRLEVVHALPMVNMSGILGKNHGLQEIIRILRPDFVIKGKEHEEKYNEESAVLDEIGGRLIFSAGSIVPSVMDQSVKINGTHLPLYKPNGYLNRHNINTEQLLKLFEVMKTLKVMVVGDVIVDEYIQCDALGMSQEDPTIVVSPVESKSYLGGAGIVAAHAAGLGAKVEFFTICGEDNTADFVQKHLLNYNVSAHIYKDNSRPTTLKQRFRCKGKTLLRVSHLRQHAVEQKIYNAMLAKMEAHLGQTDLLIFSDFNYGCLPQNFVDSLIKKAIKNNVQIVADSQSSSQMGDVSRFNNTILLTPTEREARLATHDYESGLVVLADKLLRKAKAQNIIMTLGEAGILIQEKITDQLPSLNPTATDVAGAGDSLLVCTGLALVAGADIWNAAYLGSIAAAVQVSREGNLPIKVDDIVRQLEKN